MDQQYINEYKKDQKGQNKITKLKILQTCSNFVSLNLPQSLLILFKDN